MLYYADIKELSALPQLEIEKNCSRGSASNCFGRLDVPSDSG